MLETDFSSDKVLEGIVADVEVKVDIYFAERLPSCCFIVTDMSFDMSCIVFIENFGMA